MTPVDHRGNIAKRVCELQASIDGIDKDIKTQSEIIAIICQRRDFIFKPNEDSDTGDGSILLAIRRALRRTRSKLDLRLLCIERELKSAEAKLRRSQKVRSDLVNTLELCQAPLAQIAQLPPELLEEIFLRSLPSDFVTPSPTQAPINLTMVCRRWRALALALSPLWSSMSTTSDWPLRALAPYPVSLDDPQLDQIIEKPAFTTVRSNQPIVWIRRAKVLPFGMEVVIPMTDTWFNLHDPFKTWVFQTSGQWSYLRIHATSSKMAVVLTGPLPKVQTLELACMYEAEYDSGMSYFRRADFDLEPHNFCFPWVSLTSLEATETWFIVDQLLAVLTGCPNLQTCRAMVQSLRSVSRPLGNVVHTTLLSLELGSGCVYAFTRLLDSLTTPSLTNLRCINHTRPHQNQSPDVNIFDFAKRSRCPLRKFYLRDLWAEKEVATQSAQAMLSLFPTLEDVDFES